MAARLTPVNWGFLAGLCGSSLLLGLLAGVDPKFAIAASLGIGFALLVTADLAAGVALFGFLSFLELLNAGSVISVGKLGGVFLALGWFAWMVTRHETRSDFVSAHPGMSMVLALFLGWVSLSALWAESTPDVLSAFIRYLLNVLLFLIVFTAVRNKRQAMMVIGGFIAGAAAAGLYGLLSGNVTQQEVFQERLGGAGLDPNELASVLVAAMALSAGLAVSLKGKPGLRLAAMAGGGFCLVATLLTGSRGGMISIICVIVSGIVFAGRWRWRAAVAGVLVAVVAFFYITALAPTAVRDRITQSTQGEAPVLEGRTTLWKVGERMARANPVGGVGAGNFQVSSRHYLLQPGAVWRSDAIITHPQIAHNTYLQILAELGIVGFLLFASIALFSLWSALRAAGRFRADGDTAGEALARATAVALIGILVADFFISENFNKQLWLLFGIGPALLAISQRFAARSER
jgi:O-antigen ligase